MNDLKQVRDALESAKTFLGQTVYVRGYGEQQYSEVCVALIIIDRMIETPAVIELGENCNNCNGYGKKNDGEAGDMYFNEWTCEKCNGAGGTGLVGKIFNYLKTRTMGHDEVDSYEIANMAREYFAPTPAPTEKVERIDGLFDAVSVEDLPPPNTDEECENITKRYQDHEDIYGCSVSETLLEAARAYLKLQSGDTEKMDLDALKKDTSNTQELLAKCEDFTVGYNTGWNACIDHLANTGRLR